MNAPDPNCPHCQGSGRRVLFQLPEPCDCTQRAAETLEPWNDPRFRIAPTWSELTAEDWEAALFPRLQRSQAN